MIPMPPVWLIFLSMAVLVLYAAYATGNHGLLYLLPAIAVVYCKDRWILGRIKIPPIAEGHKPKWWIRWSFVIAMAGTVIVFIALYHDTLQRLLN
jgi:hypothetical protein